MEEFERLSKDDKEYVLGLSFHYSRINELPYEDRFRASRLSYSSTDSSKAFEAAVDTREWTIRCVDEQANRASYQVLSYLPSSSWFQEDLKKIGGVAVEYKNGPFALLRHETPKNDRVAMININMIITNTANRYALKKQISNISRLKFTGATLGVLSLSLITLSRVF